MKTAKKTFENPVIDEDYHSIVTTLKTDPLIEAPVKSTKIDDKGLNVSPKVHSDNQLRLEILKIVLMVLSILTFLYFDLGRYIANFFR